MVNLEIVSHVILWTSITIAIIGTLGKITNTENQTEDIIELIILIVGFPTLVIIVINDFRVKFGYKSIRLKTISRFLDGGF
jgi:hypothetical protein